MTKKKERRAYLWIAVVCLLALGASGDFYRGVFSHWFPLPLARPPAAVPAGQVPAPPALAFTPLETFRFTDEVSLQKWEQKVFKKGTEYALKSDPEGPFLGITSADSSSGLFMKTKHEATPSLYLRWKWRARVFPKKKEPLRLSNRIADDFAARVYVIFEASNLFRSDVIEYIWDENLPVGEATDSPFSDRIKLFVVRSGVQADGGAWQEETRNPLEDYQRLFGKAPKHPVGIVALMCDSDNTGTRAEADFGDVVFGSGKK